MAFSRVESGSSYPLTPEEIRKLGMRKAVNPPPKITEGEKEKGIKREGKEEDLGQNIDVKA